MTSISPLIFRKSGLITALGMGAAAGRMLEANSWVLGFSTWGVAGLIAILSAGILLGSFFRLRAREFLALLIITFLLLVFPWGNIGYVALFFLGFVAKQSDRHLPARLNILWLIIPLMYLTGAYLVTAPLPGVISTSFTLDIGTALIGLGLCGLFYIIWKTPKAKILLPMFGIIFVFLAIASPAPPTPAEPPKGEKLSVLSLAYAVLQEPQIPESIFLWNIDIEQEKSLSGSGFFTATKVFYGSTALELESVSNLQLIIMSIPANTSTSASNKLISIALSQLDPTHGVLLCSSNAAPNLNYNFIFSPDQLWIIIRASGNPIASAQELEQQLKTLLWDLNRPSPIPLGLLPILANNTLPGIRLDANVEPEFPQIPWTTQILLICAFSIVYFIIRMIFCRYNRNLYGFISLERGLGLGIILVLSINILGQYVLFLPLFPVSMVLIMLVIARRGEGKAEKLVGWIYLLSLIILLFSAIEIWSLYPYGIFVVLILLWLIFYAENIDQSAMYRDRAFAPSLGGRLMILGILSGTILAALAVGLGMEITVIGLAFVLKLIYILKL